jgi:SAM-dependent methyltransferase
MREQSVGLPKLYTALADWWPLLSAPEEYGEEAAWYRRAILSASQREVRTLLELGSGGGNNASHLKAYFEMTLVDLSPGMLEISKALNPECEHVQGDMRTVRLDRHFDAVFIHDSIGYMASEADLRAAMRTAYEHCAPGAAALFAPDHTRETFKPGSDHGGHDRGTCGLRYLEWSWDPDPNDSTYQMLMVYAMRDETGQVEVVQDLHVGGLFSQETWLRLLGEIGFQAQMLPFEHSELEPGSTHVFLGEKAV